jgi:conjugal transfer pilus assembly protein TraV
MLGIGEPEFSCPAANTDGFKCMNVRELYKATDGPGSKVVVPPKKLQEGSRQEKETGGEGAEKVSAGREPAMEPTPWLDKPLPVRSQARVMRVWVAPYEDEEGDLNAPGLVYTEIEPRRWNVGEGLVRKPTTLNPVQGPGVPNGNQSPASPMAVTGPDGQQLKGGLKAPTGAQGQKQASQLGTPGRTAGNADRQSTNVAEPFFNTN